MRRGFFFAPTNIALAKYWGKRDTALNLPINGSLSITLDDFGSTTEVEFLDALACDSFELNGRKISDETSLRKVSRVLDLFRSLAGTKLCALVKSSNNFPTGAGLASSASGLAALTIAANHALGLRLDAAQLSEIARQGSGSACRSIFGGFVEWKKGAAANGSDSVATPFLPKEHWNLDVTICIVNAKEKLTPSTNGMLETQKTSPYFKTWSEYAESSIEPIKKAIKERNFTQLANLSEQNCIAMHASAMAAIPSIVYWMPQTLDLMTEVWNMRERGLEAFFTIDAGPNVVVVSNPKDSESVRNALAQFPIETLKTVLGAGPKAL